VLSPAYGVVTVVAPKIAARGPEPEANALLCGPVSPSPPAQPIAAITNRAMALAPRPIRIDDPRAPAAPAARVVSYTGESLVVIVVSP
jgi:hypothetical protein